MVQAVAVVNGSLAQALASPDADFTSSGFGTPDAAIIFSGNAHNLGNPSADMGMSIAMWDGTNLRALEIGSDDNQGTSDTRRYSSTSRLEFHSGTGSLFADYSVSNITDGIRITLVTDNTSASRFVTVVLLTGVDADLHTITLPSSRDGSVTSSTLSFAPTALIALGGSQTVTGTNNFMRMTLGAATKSPRHAACVSWYSEDNAGTSNVRQVTMANRIAAQVDSYSIEVTDWGSTTYELTAREATSSSQLLYVLALGGDASVDLQPIDCPESTGSVVYDSNVDPDVALAVMGTCRNWNVVEADSNAGEGFSVGASDATTDGVLWGTDGDGIGTTNTQTGYSSSGNIINVEYESSGFTTLAAAALTSFGTGTYTLNWGTAPAASRKGFMLLFGSSNGASSLLPAEDYVSATPTLQGSEVDEPSMFINAADLPTDWWNEANSTDPTRLRIYVEDDYTRLPVDGFDWDDAGEDGCIRFNLWRSLPTSSAPTVRVYAPHTNQDAEPDHGFFGKFNAYKPTVYAHVPGHDTNDRTVRELSFTANGGASSAATGKGYDGFDLDAASSQYLEATITSETWNVEALGAFIKEETEYNSGRNYILNRASSSVRMFSSIDHRTVLSKMECRVQTTTSGSEDYNTEVAVTNWGHVAGNLDYDANTLVSIVDGASDGSSTNNVTPLAADRLLIGVNLDGSGPTYAEYWNGFIAHCWWFKEEAPSAAWWENEAEMVDDNATYWGTWTFSGGGGGGISIPVVMHYRKMLQRA